MIETIPTVYYTYYDSPDQARPSQAASLEHEIGRKLLLKGLKDIYDICLTFPELEEKLQKTENGKPSLPDRFPCFNISHCPGMIVCAFYDSPVGIDAEKIRPFRDSFLRKVLTKAESEVYHQLTEAFPEKREELLFRYWTLKESFIKYTGEGLSRSLTDISFSFPPSLAISFSAENDSGKDPADENESRGKCHHLIRPCSDHPELLFFQKKTETGYILSLCIKLICRLSKADGEMEPVLHSISMQDL